MATKRAPKRQKAKKLDRAKKMQQVKPLLMSAAPSGPVPIPYPN